MEVKLGQVGLSGGNTFIQRAIRYFIRCAFSHSFVVMNVSEGILSALETTETRICVTPVMRKLFEDNWVEMWDVNASEEIKKEAVNYSYNKFSGEWYGYLSYLWFIYRWFWRIFGIEKRTIWKWASQGVTCSELTASYLAFIFPSMFVGKDLNTISPLELRNIMIANTDKFTCLGWLKE
jgi:hypothetical protein